MASPLQWVASKLARTPHDDAATTLPVPESHPVPIKARAYYTAAGAGRLHYGQRTVGVGVNAITQADLASARERSRGSDRNSGYARKAGQAMVNTLIGKGIHPQSDTGEPELDEYIDGLHKKWAMVADSDGRGDVYFLQRLLTQSFIVSGESFSRRVSRPPTANVPNPAAVQVLESDMLPLNNVVPISGDTTETINQGVVFNEAGRRIAYWFYKQHPGDNTGTYSYSLDQSTLVRIPAADVSHVYSTERPGQVRGMPWGVSVLEDLVGLDEFMYNEAVRQETQSKLAVVITGADQEDNQGLGTVTVNDAGEYVDTLDTAIVRHANAGESIDFIAPHTSQGLAPYSKVVLHKVAAGWGITYAQLTGDLSSMSFSSGRMGHIEAVEMRGALQQHIIIPHVCQPMWDWFIGGAIASGQLPQREGGYPVEWHAPQVVSIDRKKEIEADTLERDSLIVSLSAQIRKRGKDPHRVLAEIAKDNEMLESLGITSEQVGDFIADMPEDGDDAQAEGSDSAEVIAADTGAAVQDTALNGAQVAQLADIVAQVGAGTLTEASAQILIELAFPLMDPAKIAEMLNAVEVVDPTAAPAFIPPAAQD